MIVKLRMFNGEYQDLTTGQGYVVIGIEADDLRILNDQGRPFLYPAELFDVVDANVPEDWSIEFGQDGERYSYPPSLNRIGFFEDFFENKREAVTTFWQIVNQRLAAVA